MPFHEDTQKMQPVHNPPKLVRNVETRKKVQRKFTIVATDRGCEKPREFRTAWIVLS